jgi:1-deoxy-D-xylulose-5-phosphate synthase
VPERILDSIAAPCDVRALSDEQLARLADEIRTELVATVAKTGGHLAPNLGVVELTIGIHRALDCPRDRIIFDVGHQSYVHKLLTGRLERFGTLRQ